MLRVVVPTLAERAEDIRLVADHFWRLFRPGSAIPDEIATQLACQSWPGNVRELRNAVERAAFLGWEPSEPEAALSYTQAKELACRSWESAWIKARLEASGGNVSKTGRDAQMSRSYLRELIARYGLGTTSDDDA